jgi:hypothetical protein
MSIFTSGKVRRFWIRLLHWEYWSFHVIYIPIYPIWLFLCLRARSLFFFAASNPGIKNGGFLNESKQEIYSLTPPDLQPKTLFFEAGHPPDEILGQIRAAGFVFPMIGKPNIGGKGRGVKKLIDEDEILTYARKSALDFHIQEFIPYENEMGIFYFRFPDQPQGSISGIAGKEFLSVTGDGRRSVRDLLMMNPRALLQLPQLEKNEPSQLLRVIPAGEDFIVVPYGNHARGAKFTDESHQISQELIRTLEGVCCRIPGFYFGRLDVRYRSLADLREGRHFMIVEVNGAGSEPTHIYDPRHSLFFAWREIIRHWIILYKISRLNHRRGYPYLSFAAGIQMFREDHHHSKQLDQTENPG